MVFLTKDYCSHAHAYMHDYVLLSKGIQILNLSDNRVLSNWDTVASITVQLPRLVSLDLRYAYSWTAIERLERRGLSCVTNCVCVVDFHAPFISENKQLRLPSVPSVLAQSFRSLRELFINRMELKWQQVSLRLCVCVHMTFSLCNKMNVKL